MKPFKPALALCLALAIPFALAACSGGGGELTIPAIPTIPVEVSLKPLPTQPSAPEQPGGTGQPEQSPETPPPNDGTPQPASGAAKFFPLKADHLTRMDFLFAGDYRLDHSLDGRTALDTLIPPMTTHERERDYPPISTNIPQFSAFDFGESNTINGIPVQQATAAQANRYAAYAYQAILEHSAHIFQTGMHHQEDLTYSQHFTTLPYVASLSTGKRATLSDGSSGISGTWTGKAFGIESIGRRDTPIVRIGGLNSPPTLALTEARTVTADVEITANLRSGSAFPNSTLDMRFYNWEGS